MKKFISAILAMSAILSLCACGNNAETVTETETSAKISETTSTVTTTAEKITATETTTVTTEETVPLTPLEEAYLWAEKSPDRFLYDFTGDGFPECVELLSEPFVIAGGISSTAYGWRDNISNIVIGDCLYVCRDGNGKNFIVTCYSTDAMAGMTPFTAVRYDFCADGLTETTIGELEIYHGGDKPYIGKCTFLGEELDRGADGIFKKRFTEYISEYELADTITINYENGEFKADFGADTDFSEEYINDFPEYRTEKVLVGGFEYDNDFPTFFLNDKCFENGFDYDELNKLKNLDYISFGYISEENAEKAAIKHGDWCGKVKTVYVEAAEWGGVEGFSELCNVEFAIVSGNGVKAADLEFLKEMPSIRYIYAYFTANSADAFIPLSEMPNLEAIIDSGHGSCMETLTDEEKQRVKELLPEEKYFWGMVK
ncbi:MAG: hypothetical protein NC253_05850 [Ruminococcus sp.]|nr:hypothetical protein [Ruminococcus sp.]MCM1479746.1 hypothetical protein [Muribaculaceae bacterium]